ncbi:MAG TPA: LLM class flavin-dependent oxidoreductase [Acidimicrobiales bacterium]|nr:LLM class flavin-dependent oxidoreductase [Acidimicrobiales bacterium]
MKIRIGIGMGSLSGALDGERFGAMVDDLERLRFDSLWLSERATGHAPDPMIGLAVAAGRTKKLKLGTSVQVLSGRNPALVAKEWASLDRLSNGRALPAFGLGVADPNEQQAFGIARDQRASWFDEALPLIRRFWTGPVDHDGEHFHYSGLDIGPKPVQSPPDVWLGGQAPSELRRVGRLGDGWLPSFCTPDDAQAGRPVVEEAADKAGRAIDPEHFGALVIYVPGTEVPPLLAAVVNRRRPDLDPTAVIPAGHAALRRQLEAFVERGFSKLVVVPAGDPASWTDELEALAAEVLPLQA